MKKELLVPVGNIQCLNAAVHNGADAVYLGMKSFGARKFAGNFSKEELIEAVRLCHLYGVKIYVTMNTLVKDHEVDEFLETIEFLHETTVDAVIIQDFGMMCLVRETFPHLEIHASTQFNNSRPETLELLEKIGVKRVVLSRELSLDEINKIKTPLEKEVFIHGALCISYSGNCYMSSMLGNRSGNRGECTGCCRLPFSLYEDDKCISSNKYLLSTKEFNTSTVFNDLLNSDILSFKIEGRMKSAEYVAFITKLYRDLIDHNDINLEETLDTLKVLFNREFTKGHLFNEDNILNINSPNHQGLDIGKVIHVSNKKITIQLDRDITQEDAIRFKESNKGMVVNYLYDQRDRLINKAKSGDIILVDNKIELDTLDTVCKTKDKNITSELLHYQVKRIDVHITLNAYINKELEIIINDGDVAITKKGNLVSEAISAPMTKERIEQQLKKLGDTPFVCHDMVINMDQNIFISIKELNELRREVTTELICKRENKKSNFTKNTVSFPNLNITPTNQLSVVLKNEEQLKYCLTNKNISNIYTEDKELYLKYKDNYQIKFKIPRNSTEEIKDDCLVSEYVDFSKYHQLVGNYSLNVYNIYSVYYLMKYGLNKIMLSIELADDEINDLLNCFSTQFGFKPNVELLGFGRVENMIIKGNILNINQNNVHYNIRNNKDLSFFVYFNGKHTIVYNHEANKDLKIDLKDVNVRLDFYRETSEEIEDVVKTIINCK